MWIASILVGITFGIILNILYSAVRHTWPENYFGLDGSVDPIISRNAYRYLIFRFVPPFVAVAASALTAERFGGRPLLAGMATAVIHILRLVPAAINAGRAGRRRLLSATIIVAMILIALAFGAVQARAVFDPVIPRPSELVANLWAGLLAAIGAVYLQRVALVKRSPGALVRRSLCEIPVDPVRVGTARLRENGIDDKILLAILAAENLQRPPWFRAIEYRLPDFLDATTGLLQQKRAVSDSDSISRGVDWLIEVAEPRPAPDSYGHVDERSWRTRIFEQYNDGDEFMAIVSGAYDLVDDDPVLAARFRGDD